MQEHGITITPYDDFQDPFWPIRLRIAHLGATMNGVFLEGAQFGSPTTREISHGDVAGWGGDRITFYDEWQDYTSNPDGYAYCQAKLAHPGTTFKMLDLVEDADGYNIAMQLRGSPDLAISDAVKQYYALGTGGYHTRLNDFYNKRFVAAPDVGGDMVLVFAQEMLLHMDDIIIVKGRNWLIRKQLDVIKSLWQDPPDIPVESLFAHPHNTILFRTWVVLSRR